MTFNKNIITVAVATGMMASTIVTAQTESFPPPPPPIFEDMNAPPPDAFPSANPQAGPAPRPGGGSFRGGGNPNPGGGGRETRILAPSKGKNGVLTDAQRAKFAKANPEDITSENFPETIESFDFPNVDITDIIKAISELTGKNFIIDSTVRGKITIVAPSKITVAEAYKAFLSSLAINGFTVVPSGGFLKIRNARSAQRDNIDTYSGSYYPNTDQMITKIVHLKHISAEAIQQQLRLLTSSYGEMSPFSSTNSLIISDFGANIDRVMKILNQLDVPGFEEQLEVIGVKYARAKDIADLIDKIINKGQKGPSGGGGGGFSSGVPRFSSGSSRGGSGGQQGASYFMVFPEERTSSLIVVGNRAGINRVKKLIAQLDFKVKTDAQGGVYVYYVKNGDAEKIAQTLQEVAKDAGPKAATPGGGGLGGAASILAPQGQAAVREGLFGGDVQIKADKNTNALVISASKQDYEKVLNILTKLDIPRDQVFVEGVIMEMALSDAFEQSAGFLKFNEGGGKAGFTSSAEGAADFLNPLTGGSAILGFASKSMVSIPNPIDPTKIIKVPDIIGYINLLKSFGKTNILSTPQILAMDNQEAEIEVGDQVITGATFTPGQNGAASQATPIFGEAKITLKIKPIISPNSNSVRMEVQQTAGQISTLTVPKNFSGLAQPLSTRKIKTTIIVQNGDTAVLGGLIKDEELETVKKVPLLGDLPVLGWLFKGKKSDKKKVNMLVFLTPKIIRNPADQQNLLSNKAQERLQFIKQQGGKDPFGGTMDKVLKRETRIPQNIPVKR